MNKAGLDLIKRFEGKRLSAYKDPVGIVTIGYGTTAAAGLGIVPTMGMTITEFEAEWYLQKAVDKFEAQVLPYILANASENEKAAFVSLAYNVGPSAFKRSSALRHFNNGDKARASDAILLWNKAGGKVLRGLVRRRKAERALFLTPDATLTHSDPQTAPAGGVGGLAAIIAAFLAALFGKARP